MRHIEALIDDGGGIMVGVVGPIRFGQLHNIQSISKPPIVALRPKAICADDFDAFLTALDADTLVSVLVELARDHAPVRARLARPQLGSQPKALAAEFKKSLGSWCRSTRYIDFRESEAFGQELIVWLGQVERELAPLDPVAALTTRRSFHRKRRAPLRARRRLGLSRCPLETDQHILHGGLSKSSSPWW